MFKSFPSQFLSGYCCLGCDFHHVLCFSEISVSPEAGNHLSCSRLFLEFSGLHCCSFVKVQCRAFASGTESNRIHWNPSEIWLAYFLLFVVAVLGGNSDIIPQRLGSVNNFFQLFPQRKFCFFAVDFYNIISFSHLSTTFYSYFSWLLRDFFKQEEKAQKKKSLQIKIFFYSYW